jgi:DNA processing protein
MAPSELVALAVNRVPFLKPREKLLLVELCATPERLARLSGSFLPAVLGRPVRSRSWDPDAELARAEAERKCLTAGAIQCTFVWSSDFPQLLREIYDPPVVLYYRGILPAPQETWVGIVGTRHPTGAGREAAFALGFELAGLGVGTVSGLARGIDVEAHRGTLARRGRTVAVLGNGIDRVFPASSAPVGRRILSEGGCILSELPPGEPPRPFHFPARNRIISGLCRTVAVIQAPESSGALITADYALEQGRELVVHAEGLEGPAGAGTRRLAEQGAEVLRSAADILAGWGLPRSAAPPPAPGAAGAAGDPAERRDASGPDGASGLAPAQGGLPARLARQLEGELAHELVVHNGEVLHG